VTEKREKEGGISLERGGRARARLMRKEERDFPRREKQEIESFRGSDDTRREKTINNSKQEKVRKRNKRVSLSLSFFSVAGRVAPFITPHSDNALAS
jgi:hypothetical protein